MFPPAAVWPLAVALNGFWLYLGALDVVGVAPRTALTACWYALVGALCLATAWSHRSTLRLRLAARAPMTRLYLAAGTVVAAWFLLNVLLISHGSLPRTYAGELVFLTLPATVAAFSLSRPRMRDLALAVALLGAGYLLVELGALAHHPHASRFSPIAELDPISAAAFPALGSIALLVLWPERRRRALLHGAAVAALCAGALLPGSRGPVLALVAGIVLASLLLPRGAQAVAASAILIGCTAGYGGSKAIGSSDYLTAGSHSTTSIPYSTIHIREEWWRKVVRTIPDAPVVGHGVAMLVDDTREAKQMGVSGQHTYPHNSPLESLYSLGIIGAVPYLLLLVSGIAALVAVIRRGGDAAAFLLGLYAFAFASANISGEIGADAPLWAAGALAVALYADARLERTPAPPVQQPAAERPGQMAAR